jgi:hypothetical protein
MTSSPITASFHDKSYGETVSAFAIPRRSSMPFTKMSKAENTSRHSRSREFWPDGLKGKTIKRRSRIADAPGVQQDASSTTTRSTTKMSSSSTTRQSKEHSDLARHFDDLRFSSTVDVMSEGGEAARVRARQVEEAKLPKLRRPYVGGFAAAAFEATRHFFYTTEDE